MKNIMTIFMDRGTLPKELIAIYKSLQELEHNGVAKTINQDTDFLTPHFQNIGGILKQFGLDQEGWDKLKVLKYSTPENPESLLAELNKATVTLKNGFGIRRI